MSKVRKVYNLRKTSNVRAQSQPQESRLSNVKQENQNPLLLSDIGERNLSTISQGGREGIAKMIEQSPEQYQVEGQELVIDHLQLNFNVRLADIERKEVRIRNIGNSAVYLQFSFKNSPKINSSGFKDPKLKFYCHYDNNVIRPGEESSFIFSFLSQFPGSFTEEVDILCQPPLKTQIPGIKLTGKAFIADSWQQKRSKFHKNLQQQILKQQISEIISDLVDQVKLPPPPRPNVSDPKIAEVQFQKQNKHLNLYYNDYLHNWFDQLYNQVCDKGGIANQERYWNQSVETLKRLINSAQFLDDVQMKCFSDRLEHYCYLSMSPLPNKSQLYSTIYEFFLTAGYHLGGDYVDASRKELDMWQIAFREPQQSDTPEQLKQRKDEIDKIKSEWVKKAKKKKWGAEQQAELVNDFKKRVQAKTTENILSRFTNFQEKAQFIKAELYLKESTFSLQQYHKSLQRMKTVKQYPLQGKKVMIKWNLKLKDNCQQKLKQLEEYLAKKKQQEKRIQQEKKNEGGKKKKAPPKPKKKGQKEQDEQKPLVFDFSSILDEENWNGFSETFRIVLEKQPQLLFIGITYGPRSGRFLSQYSVLFLLEHLKTLEPAIQFLPHEGLSAIPQRIQNQSLGDGSILLLQNLNFLPFETTQEEIFHESAEGVSSISRRKLLHPEIREFFDQINKFIDVLVTQDRFNNQISGFTAYLNREVVLGSLWWKYIGLSMRIQNANVIFGEDFTPENYILLSQLVKNCSRIYLSGLSGLKFYLTKHNLASLGKVNLGTTEKEIISSFISELQTNHLSDKIVIPNDFILQKQQGQKVIYNGGEAIQNSIIIDIGPSSVKQYSQILSGSLFILGETSIKRDSDILSNSITSILKNLYKKQQQKRQRHSIQSGSPLGINYNQDLVVYLIGISQHLVEKLELKQKKVKISQEQNEQPAQQEQQVGESDKKKIDQISDFRLISCSCLYRLWSGKFDMGLKDIYKYEPIHDQ